MKKLIALLLLINAFYCFADGCYIPPVAIPNMPEITGQEAIISFRDGKETLIISSEADSEAQEMGWIVPLPNVPETIAKADSGLTAVLKINIKAILAHDRIIGSNFHGVIFSLLLMVAFILILRAKQQDKQAGCLPSILIQSIFLYPLFIALGAAAGSSISQNSENKKVTVLQQSEVGSYDVTVIKAEEAALLNSWLKEKKLAELPAKANEILQKYIDKKWCFVCMKFKRSEAGKNAPHPIKFLFNAAKPIYPMQLTALPSGEPYFSLFVISDKKSSHPQLETTASVKLRGRKRHFRNRNVELDHKRFAEIMWDGCVITRMDGFVKSEEMTSDFVFEQKVYDKDYIQTNFTIEYVFHLMLRALIILVPIALLLSVIVCTPKADNRRKYKVILYLALATFFILTAFIVIRPNKIVTNYTTYQFRHSFRHVGQNYNYVREVYGELLLESLKNVNKLSQMSRDELEKKILDRSYLVYKKYKDKYPKIHPKFDLRVGLAPGNFYVKDTGDGLGVYVIERGGRENLVGPPLSQNKQMLPE